MNPRRWRVRSLRRFSYEELWLYIYSGIGGLLSITYCMSAFWYTRIIPYILQHDALPPGEMMLRVVGHILVQSVLRAILWLPQVVNDVLLGDQAFVGWLLGKYALQGMS